MLILIKYKLKIKWPKRKRKKAGNKITLSKTSLFIVCFFVCNHIFKLLLLVIHMKDKIDWFGDKGKDGVEVVKTAGKAIGVCAGLVLLGIGLGVVGNAFSN